MEPKISYTVGDELIAGVITTATLSEKQRPGLWQDMLRALDRGRRRQRRALPAPFSSGPW